jgi:transposase-like protein
MSVLIDIKVSGVQDILIKVTDNLNSFTQTIQRVFQNAGTQIRLVRQIRNSSKYVV